MACGWTDEVISEGILHVVNRDDGKLVFKLPMTTVLNHDVPLTPEGVRV